MKKRSPPSVSKSKVRAVVDPLPEVVEELLFGPIAATASPLVMIMPESKPSPALRPPPNAPAALEFPSKTGAPETVIPSPRIRSVKSAALRSGVTERAAWAETLLEMRPKATRLFWSFLFIVIGLGDLVLLVSSNDINKRCVCNIIIGKIKKKIPK